ncbi:hypothetical protein AB4Y64_06965 [Lysobacter sp. TAF61]|uniref:BufA2 family periplasmic bufferin-type metallophore n=1 Tax=Lysobacter sp. TAF61 TaxID=3233072 RepID=UPI003F98C9C2
MKASLIPVSGVALALVAAGLAFAAPAAVAKSKSADKVELVHCSGVNACKGHNDCKTADNACKGQGSCKGKGFVAASEKACSDIGGSRVDPKVKFSAAAASQVHCYGVNACKGHNDCKTADNACKGHGSCKGKGFVALPAASCSNVGGNAG